MGLGKIYLSKIGKKKQEHAAGNNQDHHGQSAETTNDPNQLMQQLPPTENFAVNSEVEGNNDVDPENSSSLEITPALLSSMPVGFKFVASDEVLVYHLLRRKILNLPLPFNGIQLISMLECRPDKLPS